MEVVDRHGTAAVAERAAALGRPGGLVRIDGDVARRAMRDRRRAAAGRGGVARRGRAAARARETEDARARARAAALRARARRRPRAVSPRAPLRPAARPDHQGAPEAALLRKPEPFEALAWAMIEQLIDTQQAGNIAWAFTRRARRPAPARAVGRARRATRSPTGGARGGRPRAHPGADAGAGRRAVARADRPGADDQRGSTRCPGIGEWTLAQLEPLRPRPLRRPAGQGRRHAQRLRAHRRRAHRQRDRGGVRGRARPLRAISGPRRDVLVAAGWRSGGAGHNHRHALRRR